MANICKSPVYVDEDLRSSMLIKTFDQVTNFGILLIRTSSILMIKAEDQIKIMLLQRKSRKPSFNQFFVMEILLPRSPLVFLGFLALTLLVHAQNQSGFISIDCGLPANTMSTDTSTEINYISDASFTQTGTIKSVARGSNSIIQQLRTVRSFPEGGRNCYNVSVTKDTKYLIRARFRYENYDGRNSPPAFDLHLGTNKWTRVQIVNASQTVDKEIIHIPTFNYVYICLVNTGNGTPFISAIEIRPLSIATYEAQSGSLSLFMRWDIGSSPNYTVRYPKDVYDRIWTTYNSDRWTGLTTDETVALNDYQPPQTVMQDASTPMDASEPMEIFIDTPDDIYVYVHYAEIVSLKSNQSRDFRIFENGIRWSKDDKTPEYLRTTTTYSTSALTRGPYTFSFSKSEDSTLPPLLNAIEVYSVVELPQLQTNQADELPGFMLDMIVDAITSIKSYYGIPSNWQGDPCAPPDYAWKGLNCSYNDPAAPPTIISLNLSTRGLIRKIAPDIANLKSLESLDLSNNNLTGSVPEFLSQLQSLKYLNLNGNNLKGTIPADLYERKQSGSLSLSADGNPELCPSVSCQTNKKSSVVVPVVASVAAIFVLIVALAILFSVLKRRKRQSLASSGEGGATAGKVEPKNCRTHEQLEAKKRQFTYSEVLKITNDFERILGRGGFGTIYHGYLDDTQVAVKMLSPSSVQGYKQFEAEVKLLLRVYHRNLTSLVGYCDEGTHMGLIYEYMANGNLKDYLSGSNQNILSWEGRLRIVQEAAQGLEYLHNGCKPQIVHRDVKSTNILLDDKLQAKLADFGLSRTFPAEGGTHVSTTVAGTPGYLDPDYNATNWLTEKSDVYSLGVVLFEVITNREVISKTNDRTHISQWVISMLENGDIKNIVDPRLAGEFDINSAWRIVDLAVACVSAAAARRPTMSQVVIELNECLGTEMARTGQGRSNQSQESHELMSLNAHSVEMTPLAR